MIWLDQTDSVVTQTVFGQRIVWVSSKVNSSLLSEKLFVCVCVCVCTQKDVKSENFVLVAVQNFYVLFHPLISY